MNEYFGIDIHANTISYNPNHQLNMYTNDINNPKLVDFSNNVKGGKFKVYSIFYKQDELNRTVKGDGNPLINALKNKGDYKFATKEDENSIYNIIEVVCSTLKGMFDTIVVCKSSKELNYTFADLLSKASGCDTVITDLFFKLPCDGVFNRDIAPKEAELKSQRFRNGMSYYDYFVQAFNDMRNNNNGIFTYSSIKNPNLRKYVQNSIDISAEAISQYSNVINGKRVVIIDDVLTSGRTLSETSKYLLNNFKPIDVVFLTIVGPYKDKEIEI